MAKPETVAEIKNANGVDLDPNNYTQKELDALKAVAGDRAKFDALKAEYDATPRPGQGAQPAVTPDDGKKAVKIGKKVAEGGSLLHPTDKVTIGKDAVRVTPDDWVLSKIRFGELDWA